MTAAVDARSQAARLLHKVVAREQTSDQALGERRPDPLTLELFFGSLRHYFSLSAVVDAALQRPLRSKDLELRALMIVGAYQLRFGRMPAHAAINETVSACRELGRPWAKGLVNGVLRQIARSDDSAPAGVTTNPGPVTGAAAEREFEHPRWMIDALRREYGTAAEALLQANNARAPMCLRVNVSRIRVEAFSALLTASGLAHRNPEAAPGPETLILSEPTPTSKLPGFSEGCVAVQDAGAQQVAALLAPRPGERVLDACAAPGGKLFHLLERHPGCRVVALDASSKRLEHVRREAARLGHSDADIRLGDATELSWWDGEPFDKVLLDAPCSGSGTIRRHPDIKLLRQPEQLPGYADLQYRLLANLWRTIGAGGTLVYCTCTVFSVENDEVISLFLDHHPDACIDPLRLPIGRATRHGWQLLPGEGEADGFYYARIRKASGA